MLLVALGRSAICPALLAPYMDRRGAARPRADTAPSAAGVISVIIKTHLAGVTVITFCQESFNVDDGVVVCSFKSGPLHHIQVNPLTGGAKPFVNKFIAVKR